jgi:GH35 family endo-1,4-beta-xylanase
VADGAVFQVVEIAEGLVYQLSSTPKDYETTGVDLSLAKGFEKGDTCLLTFEARSWSPGATAGQVGVEWMLKDQDDMSLNLARTTGVVDGGWTRFEVPFTARRTVSAERALLKGRVALMPGTLQIRELRLLNYGPDVPVDTLQVSGSYYGGQEADADWRAIATERIRENRMAPFTVRVIDSEGQVVSGARVRFAMQRHAFKWGTAVAANAWAESDESGNSSTVEQARRYDRNAADPAAVFKRREDSFRYREMVTQLFNTVVFENDLKWPQWVGEARPGNLPLLRRALSDLKERGLAVKGHTLFWGNWEFLPAYLKAVADDPAAMHRLVLAHISDIGTAMRDEVVEFDVVNEPMSHADVRALFGLDREAEWYRQAQAVMPGIQLNVNDFSILANGGREEKKMAGYEAYIQALLDRGAPLGGIGFQSHFWGGFLTDINQIWKNLDRFGAYGLPLSVTEFGIYIDNEELQARYTRDFMTAVFAHPDVEAFFMWGFWEGRHWIKRGAMIREDWTPKPNFEVYRDLVLNQWWTDESTETDVEGQATISAFLGEYGLEVYHGGEFKTISPVKLSAEGLEITVKL